MAMLRMAMARGFLIFPIGTSKKKYINHIKIYSPATPWNFRISFQNLDLTIENFELVQ